MVELPELDSFSKSVLYLSFPRGAAEQLFLLVFENELQTSSSIETLFRTNSLSTKLFKYYCRVIGLPYLARSFASFFNKLLTQANRIITLASDSSLPSSQFSSQSQSLSLSQFQSSENDFEVNPDRIDSVDDDSSSIIETNVFEIEYLVHQVFHIILSSKKKLPTELRYLLITMKQQLDTKYPDSSLKILGSFLFLRFFSNVIAVPEAFGLLLERPPPDVRKRLIIVSKIFQALANEQQFGKKEDFMIQFNPFLEELRPSFSKYLLDITSSSLTIESFRPISVPETHLLHARYVLTYEYQCVQQLEHENK